jgi:hypothetical protein
VFNGLIIFWIYNFFFFKDCCSFYPRIEVGLAAASGGGAALLLLGAALSPY